MNTEITENSRCRILLVEDDKIDQAAFERLVKQQGLLYDYTIAGSFAQAKSILTSDKFDVAVVDYLLGDGTAFDVLQLTDDSPVIFATGGGDEEIAIKAMKAGAYDYIIKDAQRNYLKILPQVVEKALAHKKATDALKQYHNDLQGAGQRTNRTARRRKRTSGGDPLQYERRDYCRGCSEANHPVQ